MGEFDLIRRYFDRPSTTAATQVALGIGDDCALLRPPVPGRVTAISTDLLIEGRHFFAGTEAAAVGHKALAVNLSDLAAMGATPRGFTLGIALPEVDDLWLQAFCRGLFALSDRTDCPLVGGDTTRGPLTVSITVFGDVSEAGALRRSGARPGDAIWVSGDLGGAALAVAQRRALVDGTAVTAVSPRAAQRLDWPEPRLALGAGLVGLASAAIDLSDGLAGDLGHILQASTTLSGQPLQALLQEADLPLDPSLAGLEAGRVRALALHGGDDYELLFTAPPAATEAIAALRMPVRMIGRIGPGRGILLTGRDGSDVAIDVRGFDHFSG